MLNEARRLHVLAAMDIDVYRLRAAAPAAPAPSANENPATETGSVIAVCARGVRSEPQSRLFAHLPRALGIDASQLDWIETRADGSAPALADAPCYLFVGTATARACAAQLPLTRQNEAAIAVCEEPRQLAAAAAKRALWQAIKPLARRLRAGVG